MVGELEEFIVAEDADAEPQDPAPGEESGEELGDRAEDT